MALVVDASVALKWFVEEPLSAEAVRLPELGPPLYAPDLFLAETASVAWRLVRRGDISKEHAGSIVEAVTAGIPIILASAPYIVPATQLALTLQHPVPECLYLACAREIGARLVTADARLLAAVKGTEADPFICHLRDVVPAV